MELLPNILLSLTFYAILNAFNYSASMLHVY